MTRVYYSRTFCLTMDDWTTIEKLYVEHILFIKRPISKAEFCRLLVRHGIEGVRKEITARVLDDVV